MSKFTDFFKTVKNKAAAAGGFLKEKTAPVTGAIAKGAKATGNVLGRVGKKTGIDKLIRPESLDKRKARKGWLFVLPFVLGILLIYIPIIFDSIWFSFNTMRVLQGDRGLNLEFVGFKYYNEALVTDTAFVQKLGEGI